MRPLYHKIQTVFLRDPDNNHRTLLDGQWAKPEYKYLANNLWIGTEKVDGTNMRLHINPDLPLSYGGRTERADLFPGMEEVMVEIGETAQSADMGGLTLYGEGYGKGIQKGGHYLPDRTDFILFDVMVTETGTFLERDNVEDIANQLNIRAVPITFKGTLLDAIDVVMMGNNCSSLSTETRQAEGLVLRPATELRTRRNERIITKIKAKDYR